MRLLPAALFAAALAVPAAAAPINTAAYSTGGLTLIDFSDVAGTPFPGTAYGTFVSAGASFGERFAGQTLGAAGDLDTLSGTPTGPLTVLAGAAGQSLSIGTDTGNQALYPCGPLGCSSGAGYGEGSFAVVFAAPTSGFAIQQLFSNGGTTTFDFFNSAGGLISSLTLSADAHWRFAREGGVEDIAGIAVHTADPGGLGYDNLAWFATEAPTATPEPATALIVAAGLLSLAATRRGYFVP